MRLWTQEELTLLYENMALPTKNIFATYCDSFGYARSYDSIQKKVKALRDFNLEEEEEEEVVPAIQTIPPAILLSQITAERKKIVKQEAQWWLEQVVEMGRNLPLFPTNNHIMDKGTSLCIAISDTHIGKHTNYFNVEVGRQRILSVPSKVCQVIGPDKVNTIDEVVVVLLGDLVEGEDIYQTQAHHLECSAIEQVQIASEALWQMILQFRDLFGCTVRVETVPGNHGRTSKSANEKTNWDNIIHHILHMMSKMNDDNSIIFNCNFNTFRIFPVRDKIGMAYHHGVKHTGTPAMRERVAGWSASKHFDFMVHGHWHEWHVGNWLSKVVVSNGCLCGPDDLAEKIAKEDTARQAFFLVTTGQPIHSFSCIEWPH